MCDSMRPYREPHGDRVRTIFRNVLLVAVCLPMSVVSAKYGGGSGTEDSPFLITTAEEFAAIGDNTVDWDKHFKLMNDIDLSGYSEANFRLIGHWVGLGSTENRPFTGVFEGNGKAIVNFRYKDINKEYLGLFEHFVGTITNLKLVHPRVIGDGFGTGALIGYMEKGGISGCSAVQADVSGKWRVGGLVGSMDGLIHSSFSTGLVSGVQYVGGLVGYIGEGTAAFSYSKADVVGSENVGGLVGVITKSSSLVDSCYAMGNVDGGLNVGGLVGQVAMGTVFKSFSTGEVSGDQYVGGLVGHKRNLDEALVMGSLWDTETSKQAESPGGMGRTTAEMKSFDTFASLAWVFPQHWVLWCEGVNYPVLAWQMPTADVICPNGVDFRDFAWFALDWRRDDCRAVDGYCYGSDFDESGAVDPRDLATFAESWLVGVE